MTGSNPTDRSKLGTKRHILTDRKGIQLSAVISSTNTHDIKAITDVIDNAVVIKQPMSFPSAIRRRRKHHQHLCHDRAYSSKTVRQQIIKRGYVPHMPHKRRGQNKNTVCQNKQSSSKNKRWVVERANS
jgi:hypothetical protein